MSNGGNWTLIFICKLVLWQPLSSSLKKVVDPHTKKALHTATFSLKKQVHIPSWKGAFYVELSASVNLFCWAEPPYLLSLSLYKQTFQCLPSLRLLYIKHPWCFRPVLFIINTLLHICADISSSRPRRKHDWQSDVCTRILLYPHSWIFGERGATPEVGSLWLKWLQLFSYTCGFEISPSASRCASIDLTRRPSIGTDGWGGNTRRASCQGKNNTLHDAVSVHYVCELSWSLFSYAFSQLTWATRFNTPIQ